MQQAKGRSVFLEQDQRDLSDGQHTDLNPLESLYQIIKMKVVEELTSRTETVREVIKEM